MVLEILINNFEKTFLRLEHKIYNNDSLCAIFNISMQMLPLANQSIIRKYPNKEVFVELNERFAIQYYYYRFCWFRVKSIGINDKVNYIAYYIDNSTHFFKKMEKKNEEIRILVEGYY